MALFRVGVDSYCLNPLRLDPFSLLEWVGDRGGDGVQFSEVHMPQGKVVDRTFLRELAGTAHGKGMYLEWGGGQHVPFDTRTWRPKDLLPGNRKAAEEARTLGADVVRSCSGGFFRWHDDAPSTELLLQSMATALLPQRPVFEDLGVTLAIELHFEFTTFELLRLFEMCDAEPGGWMGLCLDTFNMLPMLEDPVLGTERALPWVVSTHVKDGALGLEEDRLLSFPTGVGEGLVDFPSILALLTKAERPINLSVEDHGGSFQTPFRDEAFLARFPDVNEEELGSLVSAAEAGDELRRSGRLAVTERQNWPSICEDRTLKGMENLRRMVKDLENPPGEGKL